VAGDKAKGVLGEAELNLSDYILGEYKSFKLPLNKCMDESAVIEVAIRANEGVNKERRSTVEDAKEKNDQNKDQIMYLM